MKQLKQVREALDNALDYLKNQDLGEIGRQTEGKLLEARPIVENLAITDVSFELPSDDIFDKPEVSLNNPLEEFYYYERPAYLEDDQKQFRERLQKALNYLKGN